MSELDYVSPASPPLPLYHIFNRLRMAGVPLGTRDYLEGLRALEYYSEPFIDLADVKVANSLAPLEIAEDTPCVRNREQLVWLCQTLWARTEDERRLVQRIIANDIELAPSSLALSLKKSLDQGLGKTPLTAPEEPPVLCPYSPDEDEDSKEEASATEAKKTQEELLDNSHDRIAAEVVESGGDMSLPRLKTKGLGDEGRFAMQADPLMSPLWLRALWRRFFIPMIQEDSHLIDVSATVNAAARAGCLIRPIMKSRAVNIAKLLILIDVGDAMQPWRAFEDSLVESLDPKHSRINNIEIAYFTVVPGKTVYKTRNLCEPLLLDELLQTHSASSLLVFGEAAAVSRRPLARMNKQMQNFIDRLQMHEVRPTVWLNPMQPTRWRRSYMGLLRNRPHVHSVDLSSESLLRGIDLLRGCR